MPIIKSAVKRVRQTSKRTARNNRVKRELKDATRALQAAIDAKQKTKLPELMSSLQSKLDTAVKKNIIPKNRAARIKSRYAALVKDNGGKVVSGTKKKAPAKKSASKKTAKKPAAKKTAKKPAAKKSASKKTSSKTKK